MAHGNTKKIIFSSAVVCVLIVAALIVYLVLIQKETPVSFEKSDRCYFSYFNRTFESSDYYKIQSVDAYYDKQTQRFYYECLHTFYDPREDEWSDTIDEVVVLYDGQLEWIFCLSWDDLTGYKDRVKAFESAKENGIHQSYSEEKIKECLAIYKDE